MFFAGTGASTPSDYEAPQHVDEAVIADIGSWVAAVAVGERGAQAAGGRS
jgi:hypothetical protein